MRTGTSLRACPPHFLQSADVFFKRSACVSVAEPGALLGRTPGLCLWVLSALPTPPALLWLSADTPPARLTAPCPATGTLYLTSAAIGWTSGSEGRLIVALEAGETLLLTSREDRPAESRLGETERCCLQQPCGPSPSPNVTSFLPRPPLPQEVGAICDFTEQDAQRVLPEGVSSAIFLTRFPEQAA